MDDLLKPVKTVRNVKSNIEKFETLASKDNQVKKDAIPAKKTTKATHGTSSPISVASHLEDGQKPVTSSDDSILDEKITKLVVNENGQKAQTDDEIHEATPATISSPEQALQVLIKQPDGDQFDSIVRYLVKGTRGKHEFNIQVPSAVASQILNAITTNVLPDRWGQLNSPGASKAEKHIKRLLLSCLTSPAAIGALVARLRSLIASPQARQGGSAQNLAFQDTASIFTSMMHHPSLVKDLLLQIQAYGEKLGQRQALWVELTSLLAGSKVLNVFQEASATPELNTAVPSWLQDLRAYQQWLGTNIASAAINLAASNKEAWTMLSAFLKRALSLGHRDVLVPEMYTRLLLGEKALWTPLRLLSNNLPRLDQKTVLEVMLLDMSKRFLVSRPDEEGNIGPVLREKAAVGGVATIVAGFIQDNEYLETQLVDWLISGSSSSAATSLETRRALILVLSAKERKLQTLLEKSMKIFSDKLNIKHDSLLQQESLAQAIVLSAGYLHRLKSQSMLELTKSSSYLHAVSNRLAASLPKTRFLGMVVGMVVSRLVDPPDKVMKFDVDETETRELEWWYRLADVEDEIGTVEELAKLSTSARDTDGQIVRKKMKTTNPTAKSKPYEVTSKIISIEEVDDEEGEEAEEEEEEEEEADLIPYQKPDDDPEDSDEDPTLINRDKPRVPVYVTELIKSLNTIEKPELVQVALKTAPSLIRRKANFGSELSENIEAMASTLINLQEGMSDPDLQDSRLQSLIACLVSQPSSMGPWLSRMYFEGDFSLFQRCSLLTTIGLSSCELAGEKVDSTDSGDNTPLPASKELPPHLASLYGPVNTIADQIQHKTLHPMALAAADEATGPSILKIRTFSSRLEVEKKTTARAAARTKRIPKNLHKLLAESLYLPLCCRMTILLSNPTPNDSNKTYYIQPPHQPSITTRPFPSPASTLFDPATLKLFLQTLTIILTNLGPNAIQLPTVTQETLLLLSTIIHNHRHHYSQHNQHHRLCLDPAVLPATLTLLLTTLDVNIEAGPVTEEKLVTDHGAEVAELVAWVEGLVNGVGVGGIGIRIPEEEEGGGHGGSARKIRQGRGGRQVGEKPGSSMPWTVIAAGVLVKWSEISRKFQAALMGITM